MIFNIFVSTDNLLWMSCKDKINSNPPLESNIVNHGIAGIQEFSLYTFNKEYTIIKRPFSDMFFLLIQALILNYEGKVNFNVILLFAQSDKLSLTVPIIQEIIFKCGWTKNCTFKFFNSFNSTQQDSREVIPNNTYLSCFDLGINNDNFQYSIIWCNYYSQTTITASLFISLYTMLLDIPNEHLFFLETDIEPVNASMKFDPFLNGIIYETNNRSWLSNIQFISVLSKIIGLKLNSLMPVSSVLSKLKIELFSNCNFYIPQYLGDKTKNWEYIRTCLCILINDYGGFITSDITSSTHVIYTYLESFDANELQVFQNENCVSQIPHIVDPVVILDSIQFLSLQNISNYRPIKNNSLSYISPIFFYMNFISSNPVKAKNELISIQQHLINPNNASTNKYIKFLEACKPMHTKLSPYSLIEKIMIVHVYNFLRIITDNYDPLSVNLSSIDMPVRHESILNSLLKVSQIPMSILTSPIIKTIIEDTSDTYHLLSVILPKDTAKFYYKICSYLLYNTVADNIDIQDEVSEPYDIDEESIQCPIQYTIKLLNILTSLKDLSQTHTYKTTMCFKIIYYLLTCLKNGTITGILKINMNGVGYTKRNINVFIQLEKNIYTILTNNKLIECGNIFHNLDEKISFLEFKQTKDQSTLTNEKFTSLSIINKFSKNNPKDEFEALEFCTLILGFDIVCRLEDLIQYYELEMVLTWKNILNYNITIIVSSSILNLYHNLPREKISNVNKLFLGVLNRILNSKKYINNIQFKNFWIFLCYEIHKLI